MNVAALAAVAGVLTVLIVTDASAAARRDRHLGHRPRLNTATYTIRRPPVRILRAGREPSAGAVRFAQAAHHHPFMPGS